jgi:diadenosine tetraphosphatase ApaH/serine/threonine PP2A family protein phosphatase
MEIKFTIVQTTKIKRRQEDGSLVDGENVHIMHSPCNTDLKALDDIIESLAEMEMDDDIPEEDHDFELQMAMDRVEGRFDVYPGELTSIPEDLTPVRTEELAG